MCPKGELPSDRILAGSPCGELAAAIRSAHQRCAGLERELTACIVQPDSAEEYALDPFAMSRLVALIRSDHALAPLVGEPSLLAAEAWARDRSNAETNAFDGKLREFCARDSVAISGRFPAYVLADYLQVRLLADQGACLVGSKKVNSPFVYRVWKEISASIKEETARQVDSKTLLAAFYFAYRRRMQGQSELTDRAIPIANLYSELSMLATQKDLAVGPRVQRAASKYTKQFFARDLARLIRSGDFTADDGARMELFPTAFPKDGISILTAEGVRIVGRVAFGVPALDCA